MRQVDVLISGGGMVGLPLALASGPGRAEDPGGRRRAPCQGPGARIRWPGLGAGLCQCADADGRWGSGKAWRRMPNPSAKSWSPTARRESRPRPSRCISMPRRLAPTAWAISPRTVISAPRCMRRWGVRQSGAGWRRPLWQSVTVNAGGAVVRLGDGEEIAAALVIAADGRDSALRSQMGVQVIGWSYPQTGIVATVEHDKPHNGVAYEHFLPSGPFAILPMTGNRSSLVWTEAKAKAPALLALDEHGFNAGIGAALWRASGNDKECGAALVLSAVLSSGAAIRAAALCSGGGLRPWHPSHRRAGIEFGFEGRGGAGGSACWMRRGWAAISGRWTP